MENHLDWDALSRIFAQHASDETRGWITAGEARFDQSMAFALGRLAEGRGIGTYTLERFPDRNRVRCLDLGAGGGGVSLGVANYTRIEAHALDVVLNHGMYLLRNATRLPIQLAVGSGETLPYVDASFDAVLCLETIEHIHNPQHLGNEIMRILRPGGFCMLTTPSRLRHLLKPDPHYGLRGLLLLPDALQKLVARIAGVKGYDVVHIFWSVDEIARCFPNVARVETIWDRPMPFAEKWKNDWWERHKNKLWDRIVIWKQ